MTEQRPSAPTRPRRNLQDLLNRAGELDLSIDNLPQVSDAPDIRERPAPAPEQVVAPPFRPVMLWVLSAPLPLAALMSLGAGQVGGFLGDAVAWGLIAGSAVLTRLGFADARSGRERRFSRQFRLPLRNVAAAALGIGTCVAAVFGVGHMLPVGIGFGLVAVLGYHFAYGLEPLLQGSRLTATDKESRAVAEALAEAEGRLINIDRAAAAIGNPELQLRLSRIADQGRGMLEQIAERPSDLRRARRFLTVFLEGTEQVTDGYVRSHRHAESGELEQNFRNVLVSIEDQFARQRQRLRQADVLDLDVQIEVLKKQLEQEGIR
ncbi:MAG: 5-bromo-4-chloroindolyl phosphate hydrolysis family protein [Thiohalocapsa sp.]